MKTLWYSRRTFISALSILAIAVVGVHNHIDVSMALASIAIGLSASNAYETKPNNINNINKGA